ncbi:uncharacterized protein LOC143481601 isoform X1 [Brachyhypopomus gauderio]|uniref:uncharacterized protein LOC143481601 isoform X1 n=1 Tax=Brachyhypopomus gauderio TaxID=698409 RepID=UPI004043724C
MGHRLQFSTDVQEFGYPANARPSQARPSSTHRRNNPHPRPDFLLPRKRQTGYGYKPTFPATTAGSDASLFPPVRHTSSRRPDGNVSQTQPVLKPSHSSSQTNTAVQSPVAVSTMPPVVWLPELQPTDRVKDHKPLGSVQNKRSSKDPVESVLSNIIPPLRPFKPQLTRQRSPSTFESRGSYSCFHVVKLYKPSYFIIHPEFVSERLY